MKPLPWRNVKSWTCIRCGECCSLTVQLTLREWLDLTRRYGYIVTNQDIGGFYLRKRIDDKCPFLLRSPKEWFCGLQRIKPLACKMWPFRVMKEPKYGQLGQAFFNYKNEKFYIYIMPNCPGIIWGRPTERFIGKTIPELVGIRLGLQEKQYFTTSS